MLGSTQLKWPPPSCCIGRLRRLLPSISINSTACACGAQTRQRTAVSLTGIAPHRRAQRVSPLEEGRADLEATAVAKSLPWTRGTSSLLMRESPARSPRTGRRNDDNVLNEEDGPA